MAVFGDLITPFEAAAPSRISAIYPNRFPTPATAWGFLIGVGFDLNIVGITKSVTGAVYPESGYLEPTIGQIWPR